MKPKILLVDDEKLNLLTFEASLADDGYELHVAEDGRSALEAAQRLVPDLILLDIMMPEIDGFTVCRRIRADPVIGRVPIIIVTALHDTSSRLEGLRAGADDFLTKPCSREEMRARVRTIVTLNRFRAIAEERARFEQLYEFAPIGIVLTDARGTVVAANPQARALLEDPDRTSLMGDRLVQRFDAAQHEAVQQLIERSFADGAQPEQELRCCTGRSARELLIKATTIYEAGQRRAMLILSDVTAEVKSRRELERLNRSLDDLVRSRTRQLEEANGLLMSYASFVSHDLRSPLTVMKGYLSMIQEGAVPLEKARPLIDSAYKAALTMQELVQNILQLAQDEHRGTRAGLIETIDPTPLVRRVWNHVAGLFPHTNRQFTVGALPEVKANALLVERVFYNLLTNAAKYSAHRDRPVIEVGTADDGSGSTIFVRDNGSGFDTRDADKLFREFSRLPDAPTTEGFGLGLSLVARLVAVNGGRVWAEGKAGMGATFFVQFAKR